MPPLGLFGSAARRARPLTPEEEAMQRQGITAEEYQADRAHWEPPPAQPRRGIKGVELDAEGMPLPNQDMINTKPASMGMFGSSAPKKGGRSWQENLALFGATLQDMGGSLGGTSTGAIDAFTAREAAEQKRATALAEQQRQIQALRSSGYGEDQIIAFMNNPEKWSESLASNVEASNVSAGDTRVYGDRKSFTAPNRPMAVAEGTDVFDVDAGKSIYSNAPAIKPPEPFTLGENDIRFGGGGNVIARGPPKAAGSGSGGDAPNGFRWIKGPDGKPKLEFTPGGPADPKYIDVVSDARARGIPEFSQTQQRGYLNQAQELNKFEAMLKDYFRVLKENGGPQTIEGPWNAQQRANIDSAHALLTLGLKQAYQGGALDKGLIEIAEKIITDPTGWASTFKGGSKEFETAAGPIFNQIAYSRAQIPDQFRTGQTHQTQPAGPASPAGAQIPPQAIQELLADPSPEAIREFEDHFKVSADEYLNGAH